MKGKRPEMRAELDARALMHSDIRPFAPWTDANPPLGLAGVGVLHVACLLAGLAGAVLLFQRGIHDK